MAMMHLLYKSLLGGSSNRKMFFKVHVFYIDEARAVYKLSEEESKHRKEFVISKCNEYGFSYTIVPLEKVIEINELKESIKPISKEQRERIQ